MIYLGNNGFKVKGLLGLSVLWGVQGCKGLGVPSGFIGMHGACESRLVTFKS